ncbi:MAG: sugar transferase [Anaerolineaceae bacterium]|nr:sugar transferase [Anaerolineaceae bacterium]
MINVNESKRTVDHEDWFEVFKPEKRLIPDPVYLVLKRIMDLTLVVLASPFWLLLIAVIFILIKLESPRDPVIFVQPRTGMGGRRFNMYKFRTMVVNAEELKEKYAYLNELKWPDFKITNDPRITRIGRFLRKSSLDELPQMFNILKGEMSLVGPRPTSFSPKMYELWHTERLDVLPGLTGLWQIVGRGEFQFDERLRLDIAYIQRRCMWLDIQILFRTVSAVFQQKGAV